MSQQFPPRSGQLPVALFVDDDLDFLREARFAVLSSKLCEVETLTSGERVLDELATGRYSVLYLDLVMPGAGPQGRDLLPVIAERYPGFPVVILTGNASNVDTAVDCMKAGALDFLPKSAETSRLLATLNSALRISELSNQNRLLQNYLLGDPLANPEAFRDILTRSDKMQAIFKIIETISPSRYPCIITGETGVGKELIARAVHKASGLTGGFVPLNVAGLDTHMFQDTLFGHNKGAFTGAIERRDGLIARAAGGTLFLDEIGDLALECQIKLLRLLQENEYYRLGSDILHKNEARIIVATNRDLQTMVKQGSFREDLYHRLSYHRLHIPPLRERREDILLLAEHYAEEAARNLRKPAPKFSPELRFLLGEYHFPGNVRELINGVSSAVVANHSGTLEPEDFPEIALRDEEAGGAEGMVGKYYTLKATFTEGFPTMEQVELVMIRKAMQVTGGKQAAAATLLGLCRQTVKKKLSEAEKQAH